MKNIMKLAVISTLMAIGIATANAQTTNVTLLLNVALSGFSQADVSNAAPVKITTKDIITALNEVSVGGISPFNFGKNAKVLVVSSETGQPTFLVRDKTGTNIVDVDVSNYLSVSTSGEINAKGGARYSILTLNFDNGAGTDFSVSGFATRRKGNVSGRGIGTLQNVTMGVTANVAGSGHVSGAAAVFRGTVNASGPKAEILD